VIISRRGLAGIAGCMLAFGRAGSAAGAKEVYESVYNFIFVSRDGSKIAFRQMENGAPQSIIDLRDPTFQVLPYTRFLFAASLCKPRPAKVLGIGLGAGAFNRLFNAAFPNAALTTVEIDPMMLRVASALTGFRTTPANQVVLEDGRRFLSRSGDVWDWIVMDPYVRNSQIPPHLTTLEFFKSVDRHLARDGVFEVNIVAPDPLFYSLVVTLRRVFPNSLVFAVPDSGNRIFFGTPSAKPELRSVIARNRVDLPAESVAMLARNGVDFDAIRRSIAAVQLPAGTPVLTDDFAPSEYLGSSWSRQ
jgi:spermidine synthase